MARDLNKEKKEVPLNPSLGGREEQFADFCRGLERGSAKFADPTAAGDVLADLRNQLPKTLTPRTPLEYVKLYFAESLMLDLAAQGWRVRVKGSAVSILPPEKRADSPDGEKERIRGGHLIERDRELREPAVVDFVKAMHRPRLHNNDWHSIHSLMRDGKELAESLSSALDSPDREQLSDVIQPYLQFVEGDARCEHTGLSLRDVWRYFRYTWVNMHKSVPGRSLMILIRDRAHKNHPVIGIAAMGSAVVQQSIRDKWIGWQELDKDDDKAEYPDNFIEKLKECRSDTIAEWLHATLESQISGIYLKDLRRREDITLRAQDLRKPTAELIDRLRKESEEARGFHHQNPNASLHKANADSTDESEWADKARTMLFRSKRCRQLASLLSVRKVFLDHGFTRGSGRQLSKVLKSKEFFSAVKQLVRMAKAEHVGIDMMDITVCGAVAPYNELLAGKLVCMLLTSPEVVCYYSSRYGDQPSIIASSMKGAPVRRPHNLVLLCTTSLYESGSSQYNRVKIPADAAGGVSGEFVSYLKLGHSEGYGSFHISQGTHDLIKLLLERNGGGRVNSIFGEGVNPLMRKIREALRLLELPSDVLLCHGNRRIVYGVPLAKNFREVLLGVEPTPDYFFPQSDPKGKTKLIADYWRKRWLASRVKTPGILQRVAAHSTEVRPIKHGAQVEVTDDRPETAYLWNLWEAEVGAAN